MKKGVLLAVFIFYGNFALADRCVINEPNIAQSAFQQLHNLNQVIFYCPTCINDNHVRYINVSDLGIIKSGSEQVVKIGEENIDLAYIYIPADKVGLYHNLGYATHCIDLKNTPVLEYLDVNYPYGIERIEKYIDQVKQCKTKDCLDNIYQNILQDYFETAGNKLKGFPLEKTIVLEEISKEGLLWLLEEISYYYGVDRIE